MSGSNGTNTLQTLTVVGGNIWAIAAQQMGDATQAWRLFFINDLVDPFLSGQVTLTIPPADPSQTGGLPPTS